MPCILREEMSLFCAMEPDVPANIANNNKGHIIFSTAWQSFPNMFENTTEETQMCLQQVPFQSFSMCFLSSSTKPSSKTLRRKPSLHFVDEGSITWQLLGQGMVKSSIVGSAPYRIKTEEKSCETMVKNGESC